jgi:thiamine pyrophosphokinase
MANIFLSIDPVKKGIKVSHFTPGCWVYIIKDKLQINGSPGDLISVLALTDLAMGVREIGFEYAPLTPVLEKDKPYAVSNIMAGSEGSVEVEEGILAVFHYFKTLP